MFKGALFNSHPVNVLPHRSRMLLCSIRALTLMAKDRDGPSIRLQVLLIPATDTNFETESYRSLDTGRFLARAFMQFGWKLYAPDEKTRKNRYAAPLQARQPSEVSKKYRVFVTSVTGQTQLFGSTEIYEAALDLQRNAFNAGWMTAKIFDCFLQEVTEKPEETPKP